MTVSHIETSLCLLKTYVQLCYNKDECFLEEGMLLPCAFGKKINIIM